MANASSQRPAPDAVQGYRDLLHHDSVTCALSDCMGRFGAMSAELHATFDGIRFAGPAITARTLACDLASVFKAIDVSQPGDIIVADENGVVVVALEHATALLEKARSLMKTEEDGACAAGQTARGRNHRTADRCRSGVHVDLQLPAARVERGPLKHPASVHGTRAHGHPVRATVEIAITASKASDARNSGDTCVSYLGRLPALAPARRCVQAASPRS